MPHLLTKKQEAIVATILAHPSQVTFHFSGGSGTANALNNMVEKGMLRSQYIRSAQDLMQLAVDDFFNRPECNFYVVGQVGWEFHVFSHGKFFVTVPHDDKADRIVKALNALDEKESTARPVLHEKSDGQGA
jgi:hypothetical protein